MKLLLHVCCAPCSVACIAALRKEGIEASLYWYNPNIHPRAEYVQRRDALVQYARSLDISLIMEDEYGLRRFIAALPEAETGRGNPELSRFDAPVRCASCYRLRMEKTARTAKEKGFDAFCTTLFISPYQNHELLAEQAEAAAQQYNVTFLYRDFRPLFREGRAEARRLGLYMQKYCGCIFSEEER